MTTTQNNASKPVLNISENTNDWNKFILKSVWKEKGYHIDFGPTKKESSKVLEKTSSSVSKD